MLEKLPVEVTTVFPIAVSPCKRFEYFRDPLYTRCIGRVPANNASYEERDGLRESESPRRPAEQWRESRGEEKGERRASRARYDVIIRPRGQLRLGSLGSGTILPMTCVHTVFSTSFLFLFSFLLVDFYV